MFTFLNGASATWCAWTWCNSSNKLVTASWPAWDCGIVVIEINARGYTVFILKPPTVSRKNSSANHFDINRTAVIYLWNLLPSGNNKCGATWVCLYPLGYNDQATCTCALWHVGWAYVILIICCLVSTRVLKYISLWCQNRKIDPKNIFYACQNDS